MATMKKCQARYENMTPPEELDDEVYEYYCSECKDNIDYEGVIKDDDCYMCPDCGNELTMSLPEEDDGDWDDYGYDDDDWDDALDYREHYPF